MVKLLLLNKWTFSVVTLALGLLFWLAGLTVTAVVLTTVAMSFIIIHGTNKSEHILPASFMSGSMIGLASLSWTYALFALLLLLLYAYSVMKVNSAKVTVTVLLGAITPWWIYLPYYVYMHKELLYDGSIMINDFFQQIFLVE